MGHARPKLIPGGRVFVWPFVQKLQRCGSAAQRRCFALTYFHFPPSSLSLFLTHTHTPTHPFATHSISLRLMTLKIESPRIYTKKGVPISVTGVAQVKIENKDAHRDLLHAACQQFLGKTEDEIARIASLSLEGHQRSIMGTMTVEEIYQDRQKFSEAVFQVASRDLINMGIAVVSYTIKDVSDELGYLLSLGMRRTAEVKRDAAIGMARAAKESGIREAIADQETKKVQYENDVVVAQSKRDFELKQAQYNIEINTKKADADLSYELQAAKTQQRIRSEQVGITVVERAKQIKVQEQEVARRERELDAAVRTPAKAEKYRMETIAEAEKNRIVLEAQANAETIKTRGEAQAFAIGAKAQAEAEAMQKKAAAWAEYKDAAMVDMILSTLPKVAAEVGAALGGAQKITLVAGPDGAIGATRITGEVLAIMQSLPETIKQMTGVDVAAALKVSTA
jgi:flotillin